MGSLLSCDTRATCHLDGQFSNSFLGNPKVCYSRRLTEQLVRGLVEFRRGMAQQSSRPSHFGASWTRMVRTRHELVDDPVPGENRVGQVCPHSFSGLT